MNQKVVKEWYEAKKNIDEMVPVEKGRLKKWEQNVVAHFPRGARILDVGCGMGREAFALADMGFSVTGIDISQEVISRVVPLSIKNDYHMLFIQYDGHTLPFQNDAFDAVVIWSQTFGLLYGDAYKLEVLTECRRVLTNCGLLSFSAHDYEFEMEHYRNCMKGRKFYAYADTELYWETFRLEELHFFAENAGYSVILCEQGEIYKPEDGVVLHCLCRKNPPAVDFHS